MCEIWFIPRPDDELVLWHDTSITEATTNTYNFKIFLDRVLRNFTVAFVLVFPCTELAKSGLMSFREFQWNLEMVRNGVAAA